MRGKLTCPPIARTAEMGGFATVRFPRWASATAVIRIEVGLTGRISVCHPGSSNRL